jgi:acyl carrier protein
VPDALERAVRRLVIELLGVRSEDLVAEVSLRDELALDSLDLVDLAIALEEAFAIVVAPHLLDRVRTYGDLVLTTGLLLRGRSEAPATSAALRRMWTAMATG